MTVLHTLSALLLLTPAPGLLGADQALSGTAPGLPGVPAEIASHLVRTYGALAGEVAAYGAFDPLVPGEPEVEAQVLYARDREFAVDADDVLRRRTTLALRGLAGAEVEARVSRLVRATEADVRG